MNSNLQFPGQVPGQVPRDELEADPFYPALKAHLIESTGLAYYEDKDADLVQRVRRRLSRLGFQSCAAYLELLHDPERGPAEMDALVETVTIGETYFFRHREHFDALRNLVLPDLIERNAGRRRLRIWSAGCADGAEPYSISILLRQNFAHLLVGWKVSILGTDINRQSLAIAREGRFERWSLRSTSEELTSACFDHDGRRWTLAPAFKVGVSFQFHNLVEDAQPPQLQDHAEFDHAGFDLIICRNVMIYFAPQLMRSIVRRFHDCLNPGAWLLVGPSEPNMTCFTAFRIVNAPGVTLYQKPVGPTPQLLEASSLPPPPPIPLNSFPSLSTFPSPAPPLPELIDAVAAPDPPSDSITPTLAELRQWVNEGAWEDAERCGRQLIDLDNLNAQAHFHYALVLEQMGDYREAERSLRRSIYLNRQAVLAHYQLGLLLRAHGDPQRARRSFHHALNLLAKRSDDEVILDADGLTVAELKQLAHTQIGTLADRS